MTLFRSAGTEEYRWKFLPVFPLELSDFQVEGSRDPHSGEPPLFALAPLVSLDRELVIHPSHRIIVL